MYKMETNGYGGLKGFDWCLLDERVSTFSQNSVTQYATTGEAEIQIGSLMLIVTTARTKPHSNSSKAIDKKQGSKEAR